MRTSNIMLILSAASLTLGLGACHSTASGDSVTNIVVDNTVGTASDAMTNVDATTGSAMNMAPDVGDVNANEASGKADKADAESSDNSSK
jgi:hypothetical protein